MSERTWPKFKVVTWGFQNRMSLWINCSSYHVMCQIIKQCPMQLCCHMLHNRDNPSLCMHLLKSQTWVLVFINLFVIKLATTNNVNIDYIFNQRQVTRKSSCKWYILQPTFLSLATSTNCADNSTFVTLCSVTSFCDNMWHFRQHPTSQTKC